MKHTFRKLVTRRGTYFVAWRPEDVLQLIINENLVPSDFLSQEKNDMHNLVRDLYLLACKGSMDDQFMNKHISVLAMYARKLQSSINTMH